MGKKKYIKNSNGVTMSVTTDTLGLEKPLLNENYDIDVHNRNMDKIDEDLTPIDDSYIIELFQHDGDTTNPRDYYTKAETDEKFATKEETNNALNKANEALQAGDNVKTQLVDKLISEGLNVSTDNTFEELIGNIALGKKWASGTCDTFATNHLITSISGTDMWVYDISVNNIDFKPSTIIIKTSDDKWCVLLCTDGNIGVTNKTLFKIEMYKGNYDIPILDGYLNDNGFEIPISRYELTGVKWLAIE